MWASACSTGPENVCIGTVFVPSAALMAASAASMTPVALQGGDLDDLAAKLTGQLCGVDLIAVLADDVHHVDGDDDRDAQLGELRGEVQVALEVRAVDDVQDRVGTLA